MAASSGNSGTWWGGWLQTAKDKSSSALDFVKKDLYEFTNVMQKDTTAAAGVAADAVKEKLTQETATEAGRKMKDGVSSLLGGISKALVIEPDDKGYRGEPITAADTHIFDRAKARLHAIQLDPETYCSKPSGSDEQFEMWLSSFVLEEQKGAISELLVSNVQVRSLYTQLVPSEVSHAHFWQRYFYKVHQLEQDEARKAALKKRAEVGAQEAELEWDDDDEWGDLEDMGSQITPTTTSTSSAGEWTQVDTHHRDDAAVQQRLSEPVSSSTSSDQQDDDQTTAPSVAQSQVATTDNGDKKEPVDTKTLPPDNSRTLTSSSTDAEVEQKVDVDTDKAAVATTKVTDEASSTTTQASDAKKEEVKENPVVPTKERGDLVVVGAGRNTPSSDSNSSQSKEVSSLDEDWEKDFDIEVSEEDIRLAQEAAQKLADEGGAGIEDDDDWENWD